MDRTFYAICGLSLLLSSCHEEEADVRMETPQRIYLRAAVEHRATTRTSYTLTAPDQDNPLSVAVWASTTSGVFKHTGANGGTDGTVALHTAANFTNGSEQLLNDAVYPEKDGEKARVFFVGMHPKGGWTTPAGEMEGKTAAKVFNGCEDVMFAPQISGRYGENMGTPDNPWPTFLFHHLLTWLRVKVKADGEAVSAAWGQLKSLKIKSKNTVTANLENTVTVNGDFNRGCVSFTGETTELEFYHTGTDRVFTGGDVIPPDDFEEVAYVLCAPVTATDKDDDGKTTSEYVLVVETENRRVEVPIDLMDGISHFNKSTMNHQFTLNLNFKMGNNIAVIATVADWAPGGISNGVLDPDIVE